MARQKQLGVGGSRTLDISFSVGIITMGSPHSSIPAGISYWLLRHAHTHTHVCMNASMRTYTHTHTHTLLKVNDKTYLNQCLELPKSSSV